MTEQSRTITRKSASNLALAFVMLPRARRDAMSVLYAFCREVDDVADDESIPVEKRRASLAAWRNDIRRAFDGQSPDFAVNRELQQVIAQYRLSYNLFDELIQGVEMDLDIKRYQTYEDLEQYCYRVASVVGLLSVEIFGYKDPACHDYAIYLGKALQLTNILRDVRTDAERGRIYIPLCELETSRVTPEEVLGGVWSERFEQAAIHVAGQARRFYNLARKTLPAVDRRSMVAAELMGSVYWRLLRKLERSRFQVFGPTPPRLGKGQKSLLIFRSWFQMMMGGTVPNYGIP